MSSQTMLLRPGQVRSQFGVYDSDINKWLKEGRLTPIYLEGSKVKRFKRVDIERVTGKKYEQPESLVIPITKVADEMDTSRATVEKWGKDGKLDICRVGGSVMVTRESYNKFLTTNNLTTAPVVEAPAAAASVPLDPPKPKAKPQKSKPVLTFGFGNPVFLNPYGAQ